MQEEMPLAMSSTELLKQFMKVRNNLTQYAITLGEIDLKISDLNDSRERLIKNRRVDIKNEGVILDFIKNLKPEEIKKLKPEDQELVNYIKN